MMMLFSLVAFAGNGDNNRAVDPQTAHWTSQAFWGTNQPGCTTGGTATLTIKMLIDGEAVNNPNYEVAAWTVTPDTAYLMSPSGVRPNAQGNYFVTIFGFDENDYFEETQNRIVFKIWDHSLEMEKPYVSATAWYYSDNATIGLDMPFPVNFFTGETSWVKVESNDLAEGDMIIVTGSTSDLAMSTEQTSSYRGVAEIERVGNTITWEIIEDPEEDVFYPQPITLWRNSLCGTTNYAMFVETGFLAGKKGNNNNVVTKTSADAYGVWNLTIANGIASAICQATDVTRNDLRCNAGSDRFACYGENNTQETLNIYRLTVGGVTPPVVDTFTVAITVNPTEAGTVTGAGDYADGTEVTVTATANEGFNFVAWKDAQGTELSTNASYTFTITADVNLVATFEAVTPGTAYTVTFNAGSGTCAVESLTEATAGAGVVLPAAVPCQDAYTFFGWAAAEVAQTAVAPTVVAAGATYHPEANCTLYAVYAVPGEGTAGMVSSISAGDVVYMVYENDNLKKEFNGFNANNTFGQVEDYTDAPSLQPLTVVAGKTEGTLAFRTADNLYFYWESGNSLKGVDSICSNSSWNVIPSDGGQFLVVNATDETRRIMYNPSSPRFATYASTYSAGKNPFFYADGGVAYATNPDCETPVTPTAAAPVIAGPEGTIWETTATVTITCASEGASIYYTLDGTTPTTSSTLYEAPITLTGSTVVKAIAAGTNYLPSAVATKSFTFGVTFANIAAFKAAYTATSNIENKITGDVTVIYQSGNYLYVQDNSAALLIYNQNNIITKTYENGDVISGGVMGTFDKYKNQIELKPTADLADGVAGTPVEPVVATAAAIHADYAAYDAKLVKLVDVTYNADYTFSASNKTTTVTQGDTTMVLYNTYGHLTATVAANDHADIIGIMNIYNTNHQLAPRTDADLMGYYDITINDEIQNGTVTASATSAPAGTVINLTATPAQGYIFGNWNVTAGNQAIIVTNNAFTMPADDVIVSANFVEATGTTYTIAATANPADGGTISGAGVYNANVTATLTATPAENYEFVNWTENGQVVATTATFSFTVTANRTLVANFEEVTASYTITAVANPEEAGTVSGAGVYEEGETVVLMAVAAAGYEFVNWTEGDAIVATTPVYSFVAAADRDLIANFLEITPGDFNITVLPVEYGAITAPAAANAGDDVELIVEAFPLYQVQTLYYYTASSNEIVPIDLTTTTFVMPEDDVFVGGTFALINLDLDVNEDGSIDVIDVMAIIQYIAGNNPSPFNMARADVDGSGVIDMADAMMLNSLILGLRGNCEETTAVYEIIDGMLVLESPVALAGYEFHLTAQPTVVNMAGFSTMGNWNNGEYVMCVFNLSGEQAAGLYEVLQMNGAEVIDIVLATRTGCKVNVEKGITAVNTITEADYAVFPVPARDNVRVSGPSITSVEVFNVMGQRVLTKYDVNADECQIEVNALTAGNYMVRINTANGMVVKNIVVVK